MKNKNRQWVKESTQTIHASTKNTISISQASYVDSSVIKKQVNEDLKIFRRHSFDDNGGGYAGL